MTIIQAGSTTSTSTMNPSTARKALMAPPSRPLPANGLKSKAATSTRPRTPIQAPTAFTRSADNDFEMFQSTPYHLARLRTQPSASGLSSAFPHLSTSSTTPTTTPHAPPRRLDLMHAYISHRRSLAHAFHTCIQFYNAPLLHSLLCGPYLSELALLLDRESTNHLGRHTPTALMYLAGAERRHWDVALGMAAELVGSGADVNVRARGTGQSALHVAAGRDNGRMVGLLLGAGAERGMRDGEGRTAMEVAVMGGCGEAERVLRMFVG